MGRVIVLQRLVKRYGETTAVDGVDLTVAQGECVFLVGGSGCGKTTTLKMINRLVEPTDGSVRIDGLSHEEVPAADLRRRIG
jgi:osmoprotectant transport system ATP-binding protein